MKTIQETSQRYPNVFKRTTTITKYLQAIKHLHFVRVRETLHDAHVYEWQDYEYVEHMQAHWLEQADAMLSTKH